MSFKIDETYFGFRVKNVEFVSEADSNTVEFVHEKSGARLLFMENDDRNKVFSISFRTPPVDDTGSAHILEHSVLCGSDKYPLKEPFVELLKCSLNTFLNAMTFSDKTMYPVASMNEADFRILMDVYLDAVFNPLIYSRKEIFMQEGWHHHLENADDEMVINGVVYNEMKGAFSDPEDILHRTIESSLYSGTCYSYESGGDPDSIPELTYEKFLDFHRRYYHPSNSYIIIYGDTDIMRHLEYLDSRYLSGYDRIEPDSVIEEKKDFSDVEGRVEKTYSVSDEKNMKKKDLLSLNYSTGRVDDVKLSAAISILAKVLFDSDSSYLKKALLDAKIADEVQLSYNNGILQPAVSIIAKNADDEKVDLFESTVRETFEKMVSEGIDREILSAAINNFEFELREADSGSYPKGLIYSMTILESWLYGYSPTLLLKYEDVMKDIRREAEEGLFEDIIRKYFLENERSNYVVLRPEAGLSERKDRALAETLSKYRSSLNEEEIKDIVSDTKKLLDHQNTPDSEEAKATIPHVKLSEIDTEPVVVNDAEMKKVGENSVYYRSDATKGITYLEMNSFIKIEDEDDIHALALMCRCLSNFETDSHDVIALNNIINRDLGDIGFSVSAVTGLDDPKSYNAFFSASAKALDSSEDRIYEIMEEILTETRFDDLRKLRDLVSEELSKAQTRFLSASHRLVIDEMQSVTSQRAVFTSHLYGTGYYEFLKDLDENFTEKIVELTVRFKKLLDRVLRSRKDILITRDEKTLSEGVRRAEQFLEKHPAELEGGVGERKLRDAVDTAYVMPVDVNYVGQGYNFRCLGYEYSGKLLVLKKYLSTEYLWNNIRVMGGAYGAFLQLDKFGNLDLVTYRDPHVKRTYEMYDRLPEYISSIDLSEEDLEKIIIGTMSDVDMPQPVYARLREYVIRQYAGDSYEGIKKRRLDILKTDSEDLRSFSKMFEDVLENSVSISAGKQASLEDAKDRFEESRTLF